MPPPQTQLPQFHVIGFTGHRQLADPAIAQTRLAEAITSLREGSSGEWLATSSSALGADLMFARQVIAAGIPWEAVLPLDPAEFQKDFSHEQWSEVQALLAQAAVVRVIPSSGNREEAYLDCGVETVNTCDVLIAVWDGEPARGPGGTADVVFFARELGRPLIVIDPHTGDVRRENFENFQLTDPELAFLNTIPAPPGSTAAPDGPGRDERERITAFHHQTDHAAGRGAPQFRRLTVATVLCHVSATIVATAALAFDLHHVLMPWAKLLFLLGAAGAALAIRHFRAQQNWVRCRLAAELSRAVLATWGMPRKTALFEDIDRPEFRQLVRSLHVLHVRATGGHRPNLDTFRQQYRRARIDDQLAYYRRRLSKAEPQLRRLRLGFAVSTVLAIVFTALYAVAHTLHLEGLPSWLEMLGFYFLPIVLPVVAAAFISFISINDLHRRVARYREMCHVLDATHKQIIVTQTWHSLEQLVRRSERALIQEVLEWHTLMSHLEAHH
jgi:uncharacterized membrane protein YhdT